jgi:diacylglycerol kinase family enzyme
MPERPVPVLINRAAGAAASAGVRETVAAAFAAAGAHGEVWLLDPDELSEAVRGAAHDGRLVVGGGDGTMNCVAQALADQPGIEIALLPLGTLNHLARDLGIPLVIEDAARLAVTGAAVPVDIGVVNGRRFVNNASVGLYPFMVRRREDARERHHLPKWLATLPAAWAALARLPHHRLRIDMGEGAQPLITPLLFIGNNRYALQGGSVGRRKSLADGRLSVFAVAHYSRARLVWFALRTLVGRANRKADFVAIGDCARLTVHSTGQSIELALDGEVQRLETPLDFQVERGALAIVAPEKS